MGKFVEQLNLQFLKSPSYLRAQYQSFMTASEWRNVEMAKELADFLHDNHSIFQFPYFRQVLDLWKILFKSYRAAHRYNSHREIIFSEYMLMNLFVVIFTTLEMIPKGLIALLLSPLLAKTNSSAFQRHLSNYFSEYAQKLASVPFYDHEYRRIRKDLSQKYHACKPHTWVDWFTWKVIAVELFSREWISKPLRYWFHQEENSTPAYTEVCVKYQAHTLDPETAKQELRDKLQALASSSIHLLNDEIFTKDQTHLNHGQASLSTYARLQVPRYREFLAALKEMGHEGIYLRKIAGQERVQIKCKMQASIKLQPTSAAPLYSYTNRIEPSIKFGLFDAPVRNLHQTIAQIEEQVEVQFVHNF